jgi:hypothetical protein
VRLHRRLSGSRIAELGAGGFLRCQGGLGAGRDQRPLFLGERRVKVQHKWVGRRRQVRRRSVESVGAFAGLDFDMLPDEIDPFGFGEALDGGISVAPERS